LTGLPEVAGRFHAEADMTEEVRPSPDLDEDTVAAFAIHLEAFAGTLPEGERRALGRLLMSVMGPLERMRLRDPAEVLSSREAAILQALEDERQDGQTR
jgi:hypothetical protein